MKGISTILAMILIVIIVVALIGLTYTFAVGLFSTTTGGATQQTTAVTQRLQKSATIVSASCGSLSGSSRNFKFTIKNTGTLPIKDTEQAVFQDDVKATLTFSQLESGALTNEYTFANVSKADAGDHLIKLSVPAGEVTYSVTC
jgi:FlaG/FlaF family flagellin (archaellin)